jgi:hypothetical protein
MAQFVHNKDTGEIGYWTGNEVIPLPRSMANDPSGAQQLIDTLSQSKQPPKFQDIQPAEQSAITRLHQALQPGEPTAVAKTPKPLDNVFGALTLRGAEEELAAERERQRGKSKLQLLGEFGLEALGGLPAAMGGKAAATGLKLLMKEGPRSIIGRAVERGLVGGGAALGDIAAQKLGVLPESETSPFVSGAMGAVVGPSRQRLAPELSAGEKSARRTAAAAPIIEAGEREGIKALPRLQEALATPNVDSTKILAPIEQVIIRERAGRPIPKSGGQVSGENTRDNIINGLERISRTLGTILRPVRQAGMPTPQSSTAPTPSQATQLATPARVQIPATAASEAQIPSMGPGGVPKQAPTPSAYGTPATLTNQPQTIAPPRTVLQAQPVMQTAEQVVEQVQAMRRLRDEAYRANQGDLAVNIDKALTNVRSLIPGYSEYARLYSRSKGYQEAGQIIRRSSDSPNLVRNLIEGKRKTTFDPAEQRKIIRAAERGVGIDWALSQMLQHPVGRRFVALGISPKGELNNAILMAGAQAMGRGAGSIAEALLAGGSNDE